MPQQQQQPMQFPQGQQLPPMQQPQPTGFAPQPTGFAGQPSPFGNSQLQPQPTGFPAGQLQPQFTGFPGQQPQQPQQQFQQPQQPQQQFQQQQNLQPQYTGFPPQNQPQSQQQPPLPQLQLPQATGLPSRMKTSSDVANSFQNTGASGNPPQVPPKTGSKIPNIRLSFITAQDQAKFEQLFRSAVGEEKTMDGMYMAGLITGKRGLFANFGLQARKRGIFSCALSSQAPTFPRSGSCQIPPSRDSCSSLSLHSLCTCVTCV